MRITQRAVTLTSLDGLNTNLAALGRLQQQLTSGKLISKPSDSPVGVNRSMQTRADQEATAQFSRNIADARSWLDSTDSTLQQMLDVTRRVRNLAVQGSNDGAMSATSREALATETAQLRESLLGMANTTLAGRPLFGGITTGQFAYDDAGTFTGVVGPDVERRVSPTESVRIDINGPEAFGPAGADLFAVVNQIVVDLEANPDALGASLDALDGLMNTMMSAIADVGARANRIDREEAINADQILGLETRLAQVEDIDLPYTIMKLQMQQTSYEAALQATAKAITPTLMDYLR
ncbi:flagellar hook-associated protein FlgL [Blastococcus atacamensis]|uniref:flagellar hook-associated protein FlgL n=1 Tax=Blastococcus atacamensis TaxID=2070508 RepID=UPI000CEC5EFA|nr:flagellar hook-associated protein FlgL [Blastococcus atacamensis]